MRIGLVLLVLLLGVPAVGASCSITDGPAQPGYLWVWDFQTDRILSTIRLGATIHLGNCDMPLLHDLDGGWIYFVDQSENGSALYQHRIGSTSAPDIVQMLPHGARAMDVEGDILFIHVFVVGEGHQFLIHDLWTGETTERHLVVPDMVRVEIADGLAFWRTYEDSPTLTAYDLHADRLLYDRVPLEELFGSVKQPQDIDMNQRWAVLHDYGTGGLHVTDLETGELTFLPRPGVAHFGLDGERLYARGWETDFVEIHLPTGTSTKLPAAPRPYLEANGYFARPVRVDDGMIGLGRHRWDESIGGPYPGSQTPYRADVQAPPEVSAHPALESAAPDAHPPAASDPGPREEPEDVAAVGPLAMILLLIATAAASRGRGKSRAR